MFNEPEIVYLLNLLPCNSGQTKSVEQELKASTLFTTEGELTPDGSRILREVSIGLVSFSDQKISFHFRKNLSSSIRIG